MPTTATPTSVLVVRLGIALVAAAGVNSLLALGASSLDDGGIGMGLNAGSYLPATVVGLLVGTVGWFLIARRAPKALRVVVPLALAVTWIPDLLLFTAGATAANVVGLMLMHLAVTTAVVLALRPTLPDSAPASAAGDVQQVHS